MQKNYKKQINKCEKSIVTTNLRKIKIKRDQVSFLLKIRGFCFEIRQHCSQTLTLELIKFIRFSSYIRQHCSQTSKFRPKTAFLTKELYTN